MLATHIAIALHMFNLLVVERYTTRKQTADSLAEETSTPLEDVRKHVRMLRESSVDRALREAEAVPALLGKRIIVVDDDQSVRDLIASILSATGCEVFPCPSGRDAQETIGRLSHNGSTPGAIISDVKLPDLNGYEVFRMARDAFPHLPVILMTGFFKAEQLVEEITRAVETLQK
jgi:CheY-like chemotaxis protein